MSAKSTRRFRRLKKSACSRGQRGVEVLLENTPNALSSAERLLMFFEQTHLDLNVCLDTGPRQYEAKASKPRSGC